MINMNGQHVSSVATSKGPEMSITKKDRYPFLQYRFYLIVLPQVLKNKEGWKLKENLFCTEGKE